MYDIQALTLHSYGILRYRNRILGKGFTEWSYFSKNTRVHLL